MSAAAGADESRWTIVGRPYQDENGRLRAPARCACGTTRNLRLDGLTSGRSRSCGCLMRELRIARAMSPVERTLAMTSVDDVGCWIFYGHRNGNGYGTIGAGGKHGGHLYVHRVTFEHFVGEIPIGLVLDHLCRVRACCNPYHVEPVTQRENVRRGASPIGKLIAADGAA